MRVALLTTDSREHFKDYGNPQPYFGTAPEALLEGFKTMPRQLEVHVISCLQNEPVSSPKKLAENIHYHGLHVPNIGWMKTGYLGCVRAVRRKLREIQPDIVHGQGTERDCAICATFSGYPNILTIHGVMRSIYQATFSKALSYYWFAKHLEILALRRTAGVIAISNYVNVSVSPFTQNTWFIPNALRLLFFRPLPSAPRRVGAPRLINIGVISPHKRQLELIEQLSILRKDIAFDVTFVGKPNYGNFYTEQFKQLLHALNTRYGGFIHYESLQPDLLLNLYDESDAMIHFSSEESFGLTFAEALSRNLALFASDVGAIREIVQGVPNCEIFQSNSLNPLITSLRNWITEDGHLAARASTPNSIIESRYHPRVVAAKHLAAYRAVTLPRSAVN